MREEALSTPDLYSNVRVLSRHALEVEQSLQKGTPKASSLRHLVQPRLQGMKIRRIASKLKKPKQWQQQQKQQQRQQQQQGDSHGQVL